MPTYDRHKLFGKHLQKIRKNRLLTQEAVAQKCGVTHQYIGLIEQGTKNPSLDLLFRIADALEISPAELLAIPGLKATNYDQIMNLVSGTPKKKQKMILTAVKAMTE